MFKKILLLIGFVFLVPLFVFFIGPIFNIAFFDFQCKTAGCSSQICSANPAAQRTTCEWKPEYGCKRDCRVRGFQCSFDPEFEKECLSCLDDCRETTKTLNDSKAFINCARECFED